ncbi:MAG: SDR family NAD(P)-dependent oxidoreductase [Nostoc sp. ChiSLP02]|nr:SDR family NAD(P)-dependent oxidoreductase [Nostoc sp. DedSLP05]MDZ8101176.1 SDR family NAD(P)-dependent oxidoreductase [Nostoc sp. DedSLP01]MDZ8188310.1 SDR family NAD(P)-dependent oxidoreductase [Nostoc sp. ChiSLP02]
MTAIAGKTVLLTGASRGLGVFIARALAKEGATIIGVSRSKEKLEKVGLEINALGSKGISIPFDISQVEQLPDLLQEVNQLAGPVDILINNAGIEIYRAFQDYSLAELKSVLSINLLAAMELTRLLLPSMLRQRSGHIVNIASLGGKKGSPYDSIYCSSKAGLLIFSDALRQELAGTGVEISAISPGYIAEFGMFADTHVPAPELAGKSAPEQVVKAVIKAIRENKAEVIVNQDSMTEVLTKLLFAVEQFFPRFGDAVHQRLGVGELNKMRVKNQIIANISKNQVYLDKVSNK